MPFWVANVVVSGLMLLSAYSAALINPVTHPVWSCIGLLFPLFLLLECCFLLLWCFTRRRLALIPLATFTLCYPQIKLYVPIHFATSESSLPEKNIKLLSYNTMMMSAGRMNDGKNAILEYVKQSDADIVCLQEYVEYRQKGHLRNSDVNKALKAYPYRKIVKVGGRSSSNKLACFSKYPILSAKILPYKSSYNGSVALRIQVDGDTLLLINNHLESNRLNGQDRALYGEMLDTPSKQNLQKAGKTLLTKLGKAASIRARQADVIAETMRNACEKYVVVCGDFNDSPLSYAHRTVAQGMTDAFASTGAGFGISYNQERLYFRIDHILANSRIKVYNARVDRSAKGSDHYPISCRIVLKK